LDAGWDRFIKMIEAKMSTKLYRVQVGAFANRANADRLCNELKSKGYPAFIKTE
jgi:N-acetylmuramoyl-L-alanine amidase